MNSFGSQESQQTFLCSHSSLFVVFAVSLSVTSLDSSVLLSSTNSQLYSLRKITNTACVHARKNIRSSGHWTSTVRNGRIHNCFSDSDCGGLCVFMRAFVLFLCVQLRGRVCVLMDLRARERVKWTLVFFACLYVYNYSVGTCFLLYLCAHKEIIELYMVFICVGR